MRLAAAALLACLLPVLPAAEAQPLRSTVVPGDAAVVIPPRGRPMPMASPRPAPPPGIPVLAPTALPPTLPGTAPMGLGAVPAVLLPLAAAALIGGGLPGSGGSGGSAPASTR